MNSLLRTVIRSRRTAVAVGVGGVALIVVLGSHLGGSPRDGGASVDQPASARPSTTAGWTPPTRQPVGATSPTPAVTTSPTVAATAGGSADNDGPAASRPQAAAITAGPTDPRDAASAFAAALLNTYNKTAEQWRAGFAPLMTAEQADAYADADITQVPHGVVGAPIVAAPIGDAVDTATVPIVTAGTPAQPVGTITLTLVGASHQWLVATVDWQATR